MIVAAVAVEIGIAHYQSRQANASGALALVTKPLGGKALIAAVALGFVAFGVESSIRSWRLFHKDLRRCIFAGLRGAFYLLLAWVPVDYLSGNHRVGSEQQQHRTASELLGFSGGRFLVIAGGLAVMAACSWQMYTATNENPADRLDLSHAPRLIRSLTPIVARGGVFARAATIFPVGVFLVVAAIQYDPRRATGIDGELADLARHSWGRALLLLIAVGLLVFAFYSILEARYRDLPVE